jgi:ATPase subunit of ABC transporter with duplicated ATPase domains
LTFNEKYMKNVPLGTPPAKKLTYSAILEIRMQQFTPYFPGFDANQQQQAQQGQQGQEAQQPQQSQQAQNGQSQPQDQQQQSQQSQQPPLGLNGANLAIYNPAAMQPLTVMAPNQMKPDQQPVGEGMDIGAHGKPKRKQVKNACGRVFN